MLAIHKRKVAHVHASFNVHVAFGTVVWLGIQDVVLAFGVRLNESLFVVYLCFDRALGPKCRQPAGNFETIRVVKVLIRPALLAGHCEITQLVKTVEIIVHPTLQRACVARSLLSDGFKLRKKQFELNILKWHTVSSRNY
jgi:hypothetical protein